MVLVCHPRESSFNGFLARRAREVLAACGHTVVFHDLYAEGFNPVLSAPEMDRGFSFDEVVIAHGRELAASQGLVVIHPDWWGGPPAMLKGWIDRVMRPGVAYDHEGSEHLEKVKVPLLKGKKGLVFCTSNSSSGGSPSSSGGSPERLEKLWVEVVMGYCGMEGRCIVLQDTYHSDSVGRRSFVTLMESELAGAFPAEHGTGARSATAQPIASS